MATRFCPSPTGLLHAGNARTALLNFLLSRQTGRPFLLRIEDTDQVRCTPEYEQAVLDDLAWLGLAWQGEQPLRQSERGAVYRRYLQQLESGGHLYPCFCSDEQLHAQRRAQLASGQPPRYAGTCAALSPDQVGSRKAAGEKWAMRFRVPVGRQLRIHDLVRGESVVQTDLLGDFVLLRRDGEPTFLFCNVLDDVLSGVELALRGEDHISNTPRQILLMQALEMQAPDYGHLPLLVGEDGKPLSKRDGTGAVRALRQEGYLPGALLNYLFRLGNSGIGGDLLSLEAMAGQLNIGRISRSAARWRMGELRHWQKLAVEHSSAEELARQWAMLPPLQAADADRARTVRLIGTVQDNLLLPSELFRWADRLLGDELRPSDEALGRLKEAGGEFFTQAAECSQLISAGWSVFISALKERSGRKGAGLFMPLRAALSGEVSGPELDRIAALLGEEKVKARFRAAAELAN